MKNSEKVVNGPSFGHGSGHGPGGQLGKKKEKAKDVKGTLKKLWVYLSANKKKLSVVFISTLIATFLNILGPYLMKIIIDGFISDSLVFSELITLLLYMGLIYVSVSVLTFFQQWVMIGVSQGVINRLRFDIFRQFQNLSIGFFDKRKTGELMSRVTNDIDNISNTLSTSFLNLVSGIQSIIFVSAMMFYLSWQLALICLSVIPLVIFITKRISKHTRKGFRDRQRLLGDINGVIEENITGHGVVKAFTKETELFNSFSATNSELRKASNIANMTAGLMGPMMNMMNNLSYVVTVFSGGALSVHGLVSVGTIASFLTYTKQFSRPLNQIAQLYTTIQSAIAGAERVFSIMAEKSEFEDYEKSITVTELKGDVEIKDLYFSYIKDVPVLNGIDISAKAGETVAIVGPTGAGKTTIISLLTRFYDYQKGSITIDGMDIKTLEKRDLRSSLGLVLQDTFLFTGNVLENIRYGRLDATDDEVIEAAKLANAHQFIHRLPKAYHTEISEDGGNLSQGQKQLISISRVILANPSILILDEATSSVDTRTEIHIQEGMLKLMEGRTSFVIAHRLSTIKGADKIVVMREGKVVETGAHKELIEKNGFYTNLYNSQFQTVVYE